MPVQDPGDALFMSTHEFDLSAIVEFASLGARHIDRAFPLIQLAEPGLSIDGWRRFARGFVTPRRPTAKGIRLGVERGRYIVAAYVWQARNCLSRGRVFDVDQVIAASMGQSAPILDALVDDMMLEAQSLHCAHVQVAVPAGRYPAQSREQVLARLAHAEFRIDHTRLTRPVGR